MLATVSWRSEEIGSGVPIEIKALQFSRRRYFRRCHDKRYEATSRNSALFDNGARPSKIGSTDTSCTDYSSDYARPRANVPTCARLNTRETRAHNEAHDPCARAFPSTYQPPTFRRAYTHESPTHAYANQHTRVRTCSRYADFDFAQSPRYV